LVKDDKCVVECSTSDVGYWQDFKDSVTDVSLDNSLRSKCLHSIEYRCGESGKLLILCSGQESKVSTGHRVSGLEDHHSVISAVLDLLNARCKGEQALTGPSLASQRYDRHSGIHEMSECELLLSISTYDSAGRGLFHSIDCPVWANASQSRTHTRV